MIRENLLSIKNELPSGVKLVAVSKFHPIGDILQAYDAGQRVFGENRPQELLAKVSELSAQGRGADIEWHFLGHLQTNKLKLVLPFATLVQSVDSLHLLEAINTWGKANSRTIDILLELHIARELTKQGFYEEEILDILFDAAKYPNIRFRGLMGMASHTDDEETVSADFARIDTFMAYLCELFPELDSFDQLSIGMSGDWRIALRHGATIVRIGTAIFGPRDYKP